MKIPKVSWSQMSIDPPDFSIFFSISKWKYFMVPFFVFLSGLKYDQYFHALSIRDPTQQQLQITKLSAHPREI